LGPSDALAEVGKVLALPEAERPAGLVFLVTGDISVKTRQARERLLCFGGNKLHNPQLAESGKRMNGQNRISAHSNCRVSLFLHGFASFS
jgi:hypothetical protein